jgi:hypothetical protein
MTHATINTMFCMAEDFDRLMEAARILCKCETPAEVARFLGITENGDQLMTNWKARGIPRTRINEISKKIGCNPFWLEDGDGIMEFVYAKTKSEARVMVAMQKMHACDQDESVATVVKISDSLAEQSKPKGNGTK